MVITLADGESLHDVKTVTENEDNNVAYAYDIYGNKFTLPRDIVLRIDVYFNRVGD